MIDLALSHNGKEILRVQSDGMANFHVTGTELRHSHTEAMAGRERQYDTSDDLNVIGQVVRHLSAHFSQEVLSRALGEHRHDVRERARELLTEARVRITELEKLLTFANDTNELLLRQLESAQAAIDVQALALALRKP
jgi:hypothetical protein